MALCDLVFVLSVFIFFSLLPLTLIFAGTSDSSSSSLLLLVASNPQWLDKQPNKVIETNNK